MHTLLLKNAWLDGACKNVLIEDCRFKTIGAPDGTPADEVIDASGKALLPPFYNTHTHAAMSLLRGYADDMPLQRWLTDYIWPFENKMTAADIREGSLLAAREMITTGTVFFSDMYFDIDETIQVVQETGMRAAIGVTFVESHTKSQQYEKLETLRHWVDPTGGLITLTVAPHAVYTVGPDLLVRCAEVARELGMKLHIHLSETRREVDDCIREHSMTPVRYLDKLGVLGDNVIAAHVVHVDEEEAAILAARGVTISHCPCSNMKLASGVFPYKMLHKAGCRITLGTDGDSSNNNLDMREEMKFAALQAKSSSGDPETMPADEALAMATRAGAEAFGIDAGVIAEGKLADARMKSVILEQLENCIQRSNLVVTAIEARVKKEDSLAGKLELKGHKYHTLSDVTDVVGARVITFYNDEVDKIAALVDNLFDVDWANSVDKRKLLGKDTFGYMSLHYICRIPKELYFDPKYPQLNEYRFEVQMRTALQHVWANMNHDTGYKSGVEVPPEYIRSLTRLAGILELADDEFSRIRRNLTDYRRKVEVLVRDGSFDEVSLNGDTMRSYLSLDPFRSLNAKIAAINQAEIQQLSAMPYLEPMLEMGLKTLGDVENMRKTYSEKAYQLALHQISGTDLDIIASTLGLQNVCLVYAAETAGEKGVLRFLDCLNGPSKYNAESAARICSQLARIHDM